MDKYDTFSKRFFAGLLDALVFVPIGLLNFLFIESHNALVLTLGAILSYSSFYVYTVYLHWTTGQTLGKKWMGVRVVDQSETRLLTFRQSFMRDSIYIVLELLGLIVLIFQIIQLGQYPNGGTFIEHYLDWVASLWFLVEVVTMLTNERRRAFHDQLAGSVVIREEFWNNHTRLTYEKGEK